MPSDFSDGCLVYNCFCEAEIGDLNSLTGLSAEKHQIKNTYIRGAGN